MSNGEVRLAVTSTASIYPAVLSGDAEKAAAFLERPDKPGPLWYVAYGSNLNFDVLKGRRRINPLEECHVLVEGLELTFDLPGLPYVEPRFANCRFATQSLFDADSGPYGDVKRKNNRERGFEVDLNGPWTGKGALIGVAYLVSPEDFAQVIRTEGGGSGYRMVSIVAKVFKAKPRKGEKEERFELTGEEVHAFTLLASEEVTRKCPGQPSERYLSLIRKGAEVHGLPRGFRAYLSSLTPYSASTLRQKLGAAVSIGMFAPPMIVFALLGLAFARKDGNYPPWINKARKWFMEWLWPAYDNLMRRCFGDGERTVKNGEV